MLQVVFVCLCTTLVYVWWLNAYSYRIGSWCEGYHRTAMYFVLDEGPDGPTERQTSPKYELYDGQDLLHCCM